MSKSRRNISLKREESYLHFLTTFSVRGLLLTHSVRLLAESADPVQINT